MKNRWNDRDAGKYRHDDVALRVYTSRLLGQDPDLVLHGGGNTSVKVRAKDFFGRLDDVLYVKGSGWDLATIEKEGFAPVRMGPLLELARFKRLSDADMMAAMRMAMIDPAAPNPSVEAILHAIIPYKFVDHTHADSIVTISNSPGGVQTLKRLFGSRMLIVPYVMPGFILAKQIFEKTRDFDWNAIDGMILLHHGIFTFHDDAKTSYGNMIRFVSKAESYLRKKSKLPTGKTRPKEDLVALSFLRKHVSELRGRPVIAGINQDALSVAFSKKKNAPSIAVRGVLTPDHVIRTKRIPVVIKGNPAGACERYAKNYRRYFKAYAKGHTMLDPAPRWAVWPGHGTVALGCSLKENQIISDIAAHTIKCVLRAEALGGWKALPAKDIFDVEYWELEQAKLKKQSAPAPFQGKVVLITGGKSGIGRACVEAFVKSGACVAVLDIDKAVETSYASDSVLGMSCDIRKGDEVKRCVERTVRQFGGLDVLVNNAGVFPEGMPIEKMDGRIWEKSMDINLSAQKTVLQACIPYLRNGIQPAVIFIASKNVPAPGPSASAYSVAKAGATQLARIAALELGRDGIRVNTIHPNQVFDTAIWTRDVLKARSRSYGMSIEEYKTNNILRTEITSDDVARLACVMAGETFGKTTGAQVPIDGGNDRVI